jgi:hypothetical protein
MFFTPLEKVSGHPELDLTIELANSVLKNAVYAKFISAFANENGIDDTEIAKINPRLQVSFNTESRGDPFSITLDKNTISLNQKYTNRILLANEEKFEGFEEEVAILSLFFALCIIHELGHVIVRFKYPDNLQNARLTPIKFAPSSDEYPEAGGYMEESLFFGGSCLLLTKNTWKTKSRKVMGLLLYSHKKFHQVLISDIFEIIESLQIRDMREQSTLYDPAQHKDLVVRKTSSWQHEPVIRGFSSGGMTREQICGTDLVIMDKKCRFSALKRKLE